MKNLPHASRGARTFCQIGFFWRGPRGFTSDGHGLLEREVCGDAEAVDEAVLVVGGKVVLADELVPVPRPGTAVEDAQTCLKGRRVK